MSKAEQAADDLIKQHLMFKPLIPNYDRRDKAINSALITNQNTIDALEKVIEEFRLTLATKEVDSHKAVQTILKSKLK
jgi:hypothetical protein